MIFLTCVIAFSAITQGHAQQSGELRSQILLIDTERLFLQSQFGQRVFREFAENGDALQKENDRIEIELSEEEQDLTDKRPSMSLEDFRQLADAFDEKVQGIRETRSRKAKDRNSQFDLQRATFLNATVPVLEDLMRLAGAVILLELKQRNVIVSADIIDITDRAIERIDQVLGDGMLLEFTDK